MEQKGSTHWLQSQLLLDAGFQHGFTMRSGGRSKVPYRSWNFGKGLGDDDSSVDSNYELLSERTGVAMERIHGVHQVHKDHIVVLQDPEEKTGVIKADGIASLQKGTLVFVKTADCVPVLIVEKNSRMVAAVHAGWRGVQQEITVKTCVRMKEETGQDQFLIAIGPHIQQCCFQVGDDVAHHFPSCSVVDEQEEGKFYTSLSAALLSQLREWGIPEENIDVFSDCTQCDPERRFFSYRGENGVCGRQIGFVIS